MMTTPIDDALGIEFGPTQAGGRTRVFARLGDDVMHCDNINLTSVRSRKSFTSKCKQKVPGLSAEALDALEDALVQRAAQSELDGESAATDAAEQNNAMRVRDEAADVALGTLPEIRVNKRQHRHVVNDGWKALLAQGSNETPVVFVRDGSAVNVVLRNERLVINLITDRQMAARLALVANWFRTSKDGLIPVPPPIRVGKDMVEIPYSGLTPLEAVISTPIFSARGTLLTEPGYHAQDAVILHNPIEVAAVPSHPTPEDLQRARAILDELICNFPFATPSDRAHAIGMAVTLAVRRIFSGTSPFHSFEAPTPGSGKNLLVEALTIPFTGGSLRTHPFPTNETELRKAITAILMEGPSVVLLDNAAQGHEISSPMLAALFTSETWCDRCLGVSRMVSAPNHAMWLMTGNNPRFSMELARRTVRVRLDPKEDRPWERMDFLHTDLKAWALEHRAELLHAILVLVQHWLVLGRPQPAIRLGSFESWSDVVGGIVTAAGYRGFLADRESIYEIADSESANWREFTAAWWEQHRSEPQSVSSLRDICQQHQLLLDVLGDGTDRSQATRLGTALLTQRDRIYDGLRIELARDGKHKGRQYRVVLQDSPVGDPAGNLGGTLSGEGSPSQVMADTGSYDDRGTLGDLQDDSETGCTHHGEGVALLDASQSRNDEQLRWDGLQGSPGSPPAGSGVLSDGCAGEPPRSKVPQGSPDDPAEDPFSGDVNGGAPRPKRHRLLLDDLDPGDVCCVASRWRPSP